MCQNDVVPVLIERLQLVLTTSIAISHKSDEGRAEQRMWLEKTQKLMCLMKNSPCAYSIKNILEILTNTENKKFINNNNNIYIYIYIYECGSVG